MRKNAYYVDLSHMNAAIGAPTDLTDNFATDDQPKWGETGVHTRARQSRPCRCSGPSPGPCSSPGGIFMSCRRSAQRGLASWSGRSEAGRHESDLRPWRGPCRDGCLSLGRFRVLFGPGTPAGLIRDRGRERGWQMGNQAKPQSGGARSMAAGGKARSRLVKGQAPTRGRPRGGRPLTSLL